MSQFKNTHVCVFVCVQVLQCELKGKVNTYIYVLSHNKYITILNEVVLDFSYELDKSYRKYCEFKL
jgi:hypothetical protein